MVSNNVGIGISTPNYPLDVNVNLNNDAMRIYNSNANGYATVRYQNDVNVNWFQGLGGSTSGQQNKWYLISGQGSFVCTSVGNWGINNLSPTVALDVNGQMNASVISTGNIHSTNISSSSLNSINITATNIVGTNITTSNIILNDNSAITIDVGTESRLALVKKSGGGPSIATNNVSDIIFQASNSTTAGNPSANTYTTLMSLSTKGNLSVTGTTNTVALSSGNASLTNITSNNLRVTNATITNTVITSVNSSSISTASLNVNGFNQPEVYNGTFSSGSLIPINFTTGNSHKYAEVKLNVRPSAGINVNLSAKDIGGQTVSIIEPMEMIYRTTPLNGSTPNVITSNTGLLMLNAGSDSALSSISVIHGESGRCHFKTDSVYTYVNVGASNSLTSGYFATSLLGSISLNTTSGTVTGSYTVIKYY